MCVQHWVVSGGGGEHEGVGEQRPRKAEVDHKELWTWSLECGWGLVLEGAGDASVAREGAIGLRGGAQCMTHVFAPGRLPRR